MAGWAPAVHDDGHTVGLARFADGALEEVHWMGRIPHAMRPEAWQDLLGRVIPEQRARGGRWMHRAAAEAIRALGGDVFESVEVEIPRTDTQPTAPPEADDDRVTRTIEVAADIRARFAEGRRRFDSVESVAAAVEDALTPYDHAILQTVLAAPDIPVWCRAVADRWWAEDAAIRR